MRTLVVVVCLALFTFSLAAQRDDAVGNPASKLATVLADLARAVPQEQGRLASQRVGPTVALSADQLPPSVRDAMRGGLLRINASNEVQVYVLVSAVSDDAVAELTATGATIEIKDVARRRVQARVPVSRLLAVAQLSFVDAIRLPTYARRRVGQVTTEGDAILRADAVRQTYSLDGSGVRVGVVSDGIKGVFATGCTSCAGETTGPIGTGDLPTSIGTRNAQGVLTASTGGIVGRSFQANGDLEGLPPANAACAFVGAGAEGTALLEIVHDLAPGAKLSFANADTDLAFAQAVNFLAASNDVVLDDIGFFGEPSDGTSAVSRNTAAALNNPSYPIRAYFTSVGNEADQHYYGAYTDSSIDGTTIDGITNAGHLHLFQQTADTTDVLGLGLQPYNVIHLPQNGEVVIFLTWDDPFGASGNNYDLYLVQQSTGRVVASSTDAQNGRQDPSEVIDYVNRGSRDFFRIVIQNVQDAAQPRHLNLFSFQPECAAAGPLVLARPRHERYNYNTATRSVAAQSDAGGSPVSVVSVGAICSASASAAARFPSSAPDESCLDTSNSTIEFFSSRGPTLDGRLKPEISAIDGVTVTGAGGFGSPFFGTSATPAHMGGIAALVLQSAPCLLTRTTNATEPVAARTTLNRLILSGAVPLSSPAPDNTFGAGRADTFAALLATLPVRKPGPTTLTFDGNSPLGAAITADQLGFSDPNQCGLSTLSWTGGCGTSPNTTMTCGFGTSSVNVSASNNGVAFSGGTDLQITVTDFAIAVAPASATLTAGQSATFAVMVSSQGGAYNSPVTLSCDNANLPPQTTCSFDPPTVTPGGGTARSTLTIATTANSSTPPLYVELPPPSSRFSLQQPRLRAPIVWTAIAALMALLAGIRRKPRPALTAALASLIMMTTNIGVAASFNPALAGARTGALSLVDNAPGSPHGLNLAGTGVTVPTSSSGTPTGTYTLTPSGVNGTLTHSAPLTLTVQ